MMARKGRMELSSGRLAMNGLSSMTQQTHALNRLNNSSVAETSPFSLRHFT